jgi:hypothetical protein
MGTGVQLVMKGGKGLIDTLWAGNGLTRVFIEAGGTGRGKGRRDCGEETITELGNLDSVNHAEVLVLVDAGRVGSRWEKGEADQTKRTRDSFQSSGIDIVLVKADHNAFALQLLLAVLEKRDEVFARKGSRKMIRGYEKSQSLLIRQMTAPSFVNVFH